MQGQILAEYQAGAWRYVLPDALGSARQLVNAAGQVSLAQGYDPFGNLNSQHGTQNPQLPFGYTGEQADTGTGLVFLRARYYDPGMGRFLTEDTKPGIAYLPKSLHTYTYAWNNPVWFTDPTGWQPRPPECDDPTQVCYTATPGPQETPRPQPVMTPPPTPDPLGTPPPPGPEPTRGGAPFGGTHLAVACYILYKGAEREACLTRVYQLPVEAQYIGNVCVASDPQTFISDPNMIGDPFSSSVLGDRKYSYFKSKAYLITGFFIGAADDLGDLPGVVGGTYHSELQAQVTVYEKGTLTELREAYDATNLHGAGVGIEISVARRAAVIANDSTVFEYYPFELVSAGNSGTTESKRVWMSADQHHYPDKAVMYVTMSAENSLPLGPAGYGMNYSMSLLP